MSEYLLSLSGSHPRLEETIQATQDWERGRVDAASLEKYFRSDVERLVELQRRLGFDRISDGQLTTDWQDMFTPITTGVKGVSKGPLVRWFNTNTFYYVPVVKGPIHADEEFLSGKLDRAVLSSGRAKISLPDPLTFVDCSDNTHYPSREELIFAYCDHILRPGLEGLSKAGVTSVQFSAPALVARFRQERVKKEDISAVGEGLRSSLRGLGLDAGYYAFFGDASPYLQDLFDLIPTDELGFDFTETDPDAVSELGGSNHRGLIVGIADARSSYVETPAELAEAVSRVPDGFRRITLAPSADLRYLPRSVADKKLESIASARELLLTR
jgi:methionine synthase II (cobalamin-independent)